jgi:hypothetical protein
VINKILDRLKEVQLEAAVQAVTRPPSPEQNVEYVYGQRIGYYAGLDRALQEIDNILRDKDERDSKL